VEHFPKLKKTIIRFYDGKGNLSHNQRKKWRLFRLPKPFKVLTDNKAATTFVKQVLDNGPHMRKLHRWQIFLSQFNTVYEYVAGNNKFYMRPNLRV